MKLTNYGLKDKEKHFYMIAALFLNITLITDLLRGINTGWFGFQAEIVEIIKVIVYALIFIYVVIVIVTNPIPKTFYYGVLIFLVLVCLSMLATPDILIIIPAFILMFFSRCLPGYYVAYYVKNYEQLFNALRIYIWVGLVYALLMVTGIIGDAYGHYMTFGYNLLLPTLIALFNGVVYKKHYLIIGSFLALCIIGFGGRGALVCLLASILLWFYLASSSLKVYKKVSISMVTMVFIGLVFSNYTNILLYLKQMFLDSRTINLLLSNNFWDNSSRLVLYDESLKLIYQTPLAFRGILSDRILFATKVGEIDQAFGIYAHNLFLELFIQYGVALGGILLATLIFLFIKSIILVYKSGDIYLKIIYAIVVGFNVKFLFSGSYASTPIFWVGLGLMVSIIERHKLRLKKKTRGERSFQGVTCVESLPDNVVAVGCPAMILKENR